MSKLAVLAIGGNSLIKDKQHETVEDQYDAICETARYIAGMIEQGYNVVVTHRNNPQVGFILRCSEIAREVAGMHPVPLVNCGADTQGAMRGILPGEVCFPRFRLLSGFWRQEEKRQL